MDADALEILKGARTDGSQYILKEPGYGGIGELAYELGADQYQFIHPLFHKIIGEIRKINIIRGANLVGTHTFHADPSKLEAGGIVKSLRDIYQQEISGVDKSIEDAEKYSMEKFGISIVRPRVRYVVTGPQRGIYNKELKFSSVEDAKEGLRPQVEAMIKDGKINTDLIISETNTETSEPIALYELLRDEFGIKDLGFIAAYHVSDNRGKPGTITGEGISITDASKKFEDATGAPGYVGINCVEKERVQRALTNNKVNPEHLEKLILIYTNPLGEDAEVLGNTHDMVSNSHKDIRHLFNEYNFFKDNMTPNLIAIGECCGGHSLNTAFFNDFNIHPEKLKIK